jgi:hypothetical protein
MYSIRENLLAFVQDFLFTLELTYEKTTEQRGEDNPVLSFYSILFQAFMSSFPGKMELRAID